MTKIKMWSNLNLKIDNHYFTICRALKNIPRRKIKTNIIGVNKHNRYYFTKIQLQFFMANTYTEINLWIKYKNK